MKKSFEKFMQEMRKSDNRFYHLSRQDLTKKGIHRKFAGTGSAGEEKKTFKYKDGGELDVDSAMVHLYRMYEKPEHIVLGPAKYYHEVNLKKYKILDLNSPDARVIISQTETMTGDFAINLVNAVKEAGYDGMELRGTVQIYKDIPSKYIVNTVQLTPELRQMLMTSGAIENAVI